MILFILLTNHFMLRIVGLVPRNQSFLNQYLAHIAYVYNQL